LEILVKLVQTRNPDIRYIQHLCGYPSLEVHLGTRIGHFNTDWHFHREWQFVMVTQGARRIEMRDETIHLGANELLILPPNIVHRGRATPVAASFQMFYLAGSANSLANQFRPKLIRNRQLVHEFECIESQLKDPQSQPGLRDRIEQRLFSLAARHLPSSDLIRKSKMPPRVVSEPEIGDDLKDRNDERKTVERLLCAKHVLDRHLDRLVTLEELARNSGYSLYHLVHRFRDTFGLAPKTYHLCVRLLEAKRLLAAGHRVGDVAIQLGFADQSHLGRNFRRVFGLSPGYYRKLAYDR
jgi:AraC-like DNA-binding protein